MRRKKLRWQSSKQKEVSRALFFRYVNIFVENLWGIDSKTNTLKCQSNCSRKYHTAILMIFLICQGHQHEHCENSNRFKKIIDKN